MFKLMAIDLDGTLLNSFGEVSENTRKALQAAKERGVEVVLASGRPISSTESLAVELGVDNYLISGNGSVVYDIQIIPSISGISALKVPKSHPFCIIQNAKSCVSKCIYASMLKNGM